MAYTVNSGFVVLDDNSEVVDWFDTAEDAYAYIDELEKDGVKKYE